MTASRREWAIRYEDGTVEECNDRDEATGEVQYAQRMVSEKRDDWKAYVGAEVIYREITTGPWTSDV